MRTILVALLLVSTIACAQNPNLGTAGAQFLQIGVGGRAMGIGGATAGSIGDASAVFWNPAGIARIPDQAFHFSHVTWWATVQLNAFAYVITIEDAGTVGLSLLSMTIDPLEVTTEQQPDGTGQTFTPNSIAVGLSYARPLTDKFSAGLTVKYVRESIWNESCSGVAFDIGTQYELWFNKFTIGVSLTNFGGDLRMEGEDLSVKYDKDVYSPRERLVPANLTAEEYPLPLHFQVGVSAYPYTDDVISWLVAADVAHPNDNAERINIGTEVGFYDRFFLRAGYRYNYDEEGLTAGSGVHLPLGSTSVVVDYAYAQYTRLPPIHRFSVGLAF